MRDRFIIDTSEGRVQPQSGSFVTRRPSLHADTENPGIQILMKGNRGMRLGEYRWLDKIEDGIYTALGIILAITAAILLVWLVIDFITTALSGAIGSAVLHALDSVLLVVMLVEILHTVRISLRSKVLVLEPFLIIGIIAAVRRVLVVTAEQVTPTREEAVEFQLAMLELGILTVMILALVGAIFIVRRFPKANADPLHTDPTHTTPPDHPDKPSEHIHHASREQRKSSFSQEV